MRVSLIRAAKLSPGLKELRIHLCPNGETSQGVRDFVSNCYIIVKKDNPKLPILIRECAGVQPRLWARYDMGKEASLPLTNQTPEEIMKQIEKLGN